MNETIDSARQTEHQHMVALLQALAPDEGYHPTALPGVHILRSDRPMSRPPHLNKPGIAILCQGRKRGYLGNQVYLYDEEHYLAVPVPVPVPFTTETDASPERPLLAIYMHLDFQVVAELMIQIGYHQLPTHEDQPRRMVSSPMDTALRSSVVRILEALNRPLEAAVLGPSLVREVYFRVLTGGQGSAMRAALAMQGNFGKIEKALRRIRSTYTQPLDLSQLAREAGMSVPTFHSHFRAVTHTSPMQYVKFTRLHPGAPADGAPRHYRGSRLSCRWICQPFTVQSRVQTAFRADAGRRGEAHAGSVPCCRTKLQRSAAGHLKSVSMAIARQASMSLRKAVNFCSAIA